MKDRRKEELRLERLIEIIEDMVPDPSDRLTICQDRERAVHLIFH